MNEEDKVSITISVTEPVADFLREMAKGEYRSLKAQTEKMLEDEVEKLMNEQEAPTPPK